MFEWKKEFALGITSIDEQHKELFGFANRIYDLLIVHFDDVSTEYDEILNAIDELKKFTKLHFQSEEELFAKYAYPDANDHIAEHRAFMEYLDNVDIDAAIHQSKKLLKELIEKLANWVFHHMITTDYLFKEYLIKLGKDENGRM